MIMPLLILLLFGIIEFGFFFGEFNEVRHGVHEGSRLAAVNAEGSNTAALRDRTCAAMELTSGSDIWVRFERPAGTEIGDPASITVEAEVSSLSGFGLIEVFLPNTLTETADFRLEQIPEWADQSGLPITDGSLLCP